MPTKVIKLGSDIDVLSTHDLSKQYPGYDFDVYGLDGDDELSIDFIGRDFGTDTIEGGAGDDFMAATVYDSRSSDAYFGGDEGTDYVYISPNYELITGFTRPYSTITEFKIRNIKERSELTVAVGDSTEYVAFGQTDGSNVYFLTEDLFKSRVRAATWEEVYARTHETNADWFYNGLDTYSSYFGDSIALQGASSDITTATWSEKIFWSRVLVGENGKGVLQAKQIDKANWSGPTGSLIGGTAINDTLRGLAGWDVLAASHGNDLVHGGNGRDLISGEKGSDELHGDFGWNTYLSEKDGYVDLIAIKSDQFHNNWWYGTSGNSPNGEKADIIEGLDSNDQIKIIGVSTSDLSFKSGVSHKGVSGIGIYAKGVLEALYTGGDLTANQISSMTTGDSSPQAMANQIWSYWGDNTVPPLQT